MRTISPSTERKLDRLAREVEDLADTLRDFSVDEDETSLLIECRDLLDVIANDWDIPVFRRNQAADLLRAVDAELRS